MWPQFLLLYKEGRISVACEFMGHLNEITDHDLTEVSQLLDGSEPGECLSRVYLLFRHFPEGCVWQTMGS